MCHLSVAKINSNSHWLLLENFLRLSCFFRTSMDSILLLIHLNKGSCKRKVLHPSLPSRRKETPSDSITFLPCCLCVDILNGWVRSGSGRVNRVMGQVKLTHIFHLNFLIFFFNFYKENNMYLPFGKLCNKLLDVKCIILNSPLISRMNSIKLINTYLIILKLYKS